MHIFKIAYEKYSIKIIKKIYRKTFTQCGNILQKNLIHGQCLYFDQSVVTPSLFKNYHDFFSFMSWYYCRPSNILYCRRENA